VTGGSVLQLVEASVFVSDCLFESNSARLNGSAIYAIGNSSVSISNSTFVSNVATHGGAIYVKGGNLTIDSTVFEDNQASTKPTEIGRALLLLLDILSNS